MLTNKEFYSVKKLAKMQERNFDIRFSISEEDLENWADESFKQSVANHMPNDFDFDSITNKIIESKGDITYSDDIIEEITSEYHFLPGQIYKLEKCNSVEVYVVLPKDKMVVYCIEESMKNHGYFISYTEVLNKMIMVVFEPYESLDATSIVSGLDVIYHYTPESNIDSILRNGLRPSSKNMFFNYPDRVYLSIVENEAMPKRLKLVSKTEDDYVKLKICVKKIPSNVKFYYDCMKENSVYTTEMIPDYCISL